MTDIANAWPQRIPHADKARIIRDFRTATSSSTLKSITCASCAEKVRIRDASNELVSDLNLDLLCSPPSVFPDQTDVIPPLPYTEGPLAGVMVDPSGVRYDEDGALFLSMGEWQERLGAVREERPRPGFDDGYLRHPQNQYPSVGDLTFGWRLP